MTLFMNEYLELHVPVGVDVVGCIGVDDNDDMICTSMSSLCTYMY